MKAILHTGETLDLPDGATPEQAKSVVKAHLGKLALEAKKSDKKDKEDAERHKANVSATQEIAQSMAVGMDALSKRLDNSSLALKSLASKLDPLKDLAKAIEGFSSNVQSLEKCVEKCTADIIKVMRSPKKIMTNTKGKPTGMMIGDE